MKTTHRMTIQPEVLAHIGTAADGDDLENVYPTLAITYSFSPGFPDSWEEPGQGAELELLSAVLVDGDGTEPDVERVHDWAESWLDSGAGACAACYRAEQERRRP